VDGDAFGETPVDIVLHPRRARVLVAEEEGGE